MKIFKLSENDYKGSHTAPKPDQGNSLHDLSNIFPDDIYGPYGARYYGHSEPFDAQSINIIQKARNKPNLPVTIYRAVPDANYENKDKFGMGSSASWVFKEFDIASFTFELLSPDYDPWFGHGKHDNLIHWMNTGLPVFLYLLVNIENFFNWDIPDIQPFIPEGVPPEPL